MSNESGYWLTGEVFVEQPLAQLWAHWHQKVEHYGFEQALESGWIEVTAQGKAIELHADSLLAIGQQWRFWLPDHQEGPVSSRWQTLWQNHEVMAVHKPANLPVSRTTRNLFDTLIGRVRRESPYDDAHLLHRLDAETSGITLLALESHYDRKWKKKLDRLMTSKRYLALVDGVPSWQQQELECWLAERGDSAIRSRVHCIAGQADQPPDRAQWIKPKWARTSFTVLASSNGQSLIECRLYSGRRHQIRTQLAWLGHPIVGDKIYSHDGAFYLQRLERDLGDADYQTLGANHHLLHAWQLQLNLYGEAYAVTDTNLSDQWPEWVHKAVRSADFLTADR